MAGARVRRGASGRPGFIARPVRWFARRFPNLLAGLVGLLAGVGVLLLAELGSRAVFALGWGPQAKGWYYFYSGEPLSVEDPVFGYRARPNAQMRIRRLAPDDLLYSIRCTTDAKGRRETPHPMGTAHRSALFFGCSFTFGEGVENDQTLLAQFARHAPDYAVYNYGYMGYGPQHFYLQLDEDDLFADVPGPVDLVVYTFIPHHIERLVGRMRISSRWGAGMPCLVEAGGDVWHLGTFEESGLWRQHFYDAADKLALLELLKVNFPMQIGPRHEAFAARVLAEAGKKVAQRFPNARFVVLMYPRLHGVDSAARAFEAAGLEVVRLEDSLPPGVAEMNLPDTHPNAQSYALVGEALAEYVAATDVDQNTVAK